MIGLLLPAFLIGWQQGKQVLKKEGILKTVTAFVFNFILMTNRVVRRLKL